MPAFDSDVGKQACEFSGMGCHDVMLMQMFEKTRRISLKCGYRVGIEHGRYVVIEHLANRIRYVGPDDVVTQEFREDRLTASLGVDGRIKSFGCG